MRVRLGGNVCEMRGRGERLGRAEAARAGSGPDEDETCQTRRTRSQHHRPPGHSCACHAESWNQEEALLSAYIIQPLGRRGRFSRVSLKSRPEHKWPSSVGCFICTLSLMAGQTETLPGFSPSLISPSSFLVRCDVYLIVSRHQRGS